MNLLELDGVLSMAQVLAVFLTLVISGFVFFLNQFYFMVKKAMEDIKNILIKDAHDSQRLDRLEEDMVEVKSDIKNRWRKDA